MDALKTHYTAAKITSIETLAKALGLDKEFLLEVTSVPQNQRYTKLRNPIIKKDGTERKILNPKKSLRVIQNRINRRLIKPNVSWADYLFGSIPKASNGKISDHVSAAAIHCECKSILKVDISNFFDNIHQTFIKEIFQEFFYFSEEVSELLSDLCCYDKFLVQGALTSCFLANILFWKEEPELVNFLQKRGLKYSRLIDDVTISSKKMNYDYSIALKHVEDMFFIKGLPVNKEKTDVLRISNYPLSVHGLNVNFKTPCYSKNEIRNMRSAVHHIEIRAKSKKERKSKSFRQDFYRVLGRVNKLSRVKHSKHRTLKNKLMKKSVQPQASYKDIKEAQLRLSALKDSYLKSKAQYSYYKRYHYLKYLLYLIANTKDLNFDKDYQVIIEEMRAIKPEFMKEMSG